MEYGGGCSLAQTPLRLHFPGNRKNNSEICYFLDKIGALFRIQPQKVLGLLAFLRWDNLKLVRELNLPYQGIELP